MRLFHYKKWKFFVNIFIRNKLYSTVKMRVLVEGYAGFITSMLKSVRRLLLAVTGVANKELFGSTC